MGSPPFHYIDLRTFVYVTEDEERVLRALRTFLPEEIPIDREESEGHHGDRIVVLSTRVENADDMREILTRFRAADDFTTILEELEERVTENCEFFLQFDKQAASQGDIALGDGVTIRAKVEAYPASRQAALENLRDYFHP